MFEYEIIKKRNGADENKKTNFSFEITKGKNQSTNKSNETDFSFEITKKRVKAVQDDNQSVDYSNFTSFFEMENGKLPTFDTVVRRMGYENVGDYEEYSKKNPELFEAMGGVKYDPVNTPVKTPSVSKVAANNVVKRFKNTDVKAVGKIFKTLGSGEWQDADTMKGYTEKVNQYVNDFVALDSMGYFNYLPTEERKGYVEELRSIKKYANNLKEVFSGYDDSDSYKDAVIQAKNQAIMYEKMENEDLDVLRKQINEWKNQYRAAKKEYDEWDVPIVGTLDKYTTERTGVITYYNNREAQRLAEIARDKTIKQKYGYSPDEFKDMIVEKEAYYNKAKYIQDSIKIKNDARNDGNYDKWSQEGATFSPNDFGKITIDVTERIGHISSSSIDKYRAAAIALSDWQSGETTKFSNSVTNGESLTSKYRLMNKDEFKDFAYWRKYDKENGTKFAYDYIDSIEETLNIREGQAIGEEYKDKHALFKIMYGVEVGLDQFASGVGNALNFTDEYIPTTSTQYAAQYIREDLKDVGPDLPKWLGETTLGQAAFDIVSTTTNMVPSLAMGGVAELLLPGSGTYVTAGLMGLSASGNAYQQMLNQGYNKTQSRTYATLVGVSEASLSALLSGMIGGKATEKAIENVIKGIDNGFLRFAVRWGMSAASEIPEESLQTLIEPILQNIALGYEKNKLEDTDWSQVAYDGLLGGISGLGLGGITSAVSTGVEQHTWNKAGKNVRANETIQNVLDIAQLTPQESDAYATYTRYANNGINAENITDTQIGRLYDELNTYAKGVLNNKRSPVDAKVNATKVLSGLSKADEKSTVDKDTIAKFERSVAYEGALHESVDALIKSGLESGMVQKNTAENSGVTLSISKTKNMGWNEQINGLYKKQGQISRSDTLVVENKTPSYLQSDVIEDLPLAIPLSVITKATKGKDISHSIKQENIVDLQRGIRNADIIIKNPDRNSFAFVTDIKQDGYPVLISFSQNVDFDGDRVHKATSIHLQIDVNSMLDALPDTATVYFKNKKEFNKAVGVTNNLRSLAANVEFIDETLPQNAENVNTRFSLGETTDGRLVAVVDSDVLSKIDTTTWNKTKKKAAQKAAVKAIKQFDGGIVVDGITRKVNRTSRREYTRSNDTEDLYQNSHNVFADKMRAADIADDIVVATTNWSRDGGLTHQRGDDFIAFDHGTTLISSGNAKYSAEVVVGITESGEAIFYDVVDMTPTTFDIKKAETSTTATTQNAIGRVDERETRKEGREIQNEDSQSSNTGGIVTNDFFNTNISNQKADSSNESAFLIAVSKQQCEYIKQICEKLGVKVVFEDLREMMYKGKIISPDGYVEKETGIIHLNTYAKNPIGFVFKHELTHYSEKAKGYLDFETLVKRSGAYQKWITEKMGESDVRVAQYKYKQNVAKTNVDIYSASDPKAETEMIADFVGDMLFTEDGSGMAALASDIEVNHRNKVIQFVLDFISYLKGRLVGIDSIALELSRLEERFNELLFYARNNDGVYDNDIRFSFSGSRGSEILYNTPREFTPESEQEWSVFNRQFSNKTSRLKKGERKNIIIYTASNVYFIQATGYLEGCIQEKISIYDNEELISNKIKEHLDGTFVIGKTFYSSIKGTGSRHGRRNRNINSIGGQYRQSQNVDLDERQSASDDVGYHWENHGYQTWEELIDAIDSGVLIMDEDGKILELASEETIKATSKSEVAFSMPIGNRKRKDNNVIELLKDNELSKKIGDLRGAAKYKVIQQYILDVLSGEEIVLSDGKIAVVDKSDALHIANKAANKKTAQISAIKKLVEKAVLIAEEESNKARKFDYFYYYGATVKYDGAIFNIYLNVGRATNTGEYHIYDITNKIRDTANRINGLERPKPNEGYALTNGISNNSITKKSNIVNENYTTDTDMFEGGIENTDITSGDETEFSIEYTEKLLDSFGITKLGDHIHVQKRVMETLENEDFFTDKENRCIKVVNDASGVVVEINKKGIKETFDEKNYANVGRIKKIAKLMTIRNLVEIIRFGELQEDGVRNTYKGTAKNKSFAYIRHTVNIDGKAIKVQIDVKKSPEKNKFWVHKIIKIYGANTKNVDANNIPNNVKAIELGQTIVSTDKMSVSQESKNVNNIEEFNVQEVAYVEEICNKLGRKVVFEDLREMVYRGETISPDGYELNGVIHLNLYAQNPIGFVFKHELTHYSEKAKGYLNFAEQVKCSSAYQKWITEKMGESNVRVAEYKYKQKLLATYVDIESINNPKIEAEMIADFVGDMLFTEDGSGMVALVSDVEVTHRNKVIQFVLDFISYLKKKIVGMDSIALELSRLEDRFNELLSDAKNNSEYDNEVKFSFGNETIDKDEYNDDTISRANKQGDFINDFYNALSKSEWAVFYDKLARQRYIENTQIGAVACIEIGNKLVIAERKQVGKYKNDYIVTNVYKLIVEDSDYYTLSLLKDALNKGDVEYEPRRIYSYIDRVNRLNGRNELLTVYDRTNATFVLYHDKRKQRDSIVGIRGVSQEKTFRDRFSVRNESSDQETDDLIRKNGATSKNEVAFSMPIGNRKRNVNNVIELSKDNELSNKIGDLRGAAKYKVIQQYILDVLSGEEIVLSDGKIAVVDKSDALHIANKSGYQKTAEISAIKEIVEKAVLIAEEESTKERKFNYFYYYEATVKYDDEIFNIYLNVGRATNDKRYHLYDITQKLRDTAHRINDVGRPKPNEGYALETVSLNNIVSQTANNVNNDYTTKTDTFDGIAKSDTQGNAVDKKLESAKFVENFTRMGYTDDEISALLYKVGVLDDQSGSGNGDSQSDRSILQGIRYNAGRIGESEVNREETGSIDGYNRTYGSHYELSNRRVATTYEEGEGTSGFLEQGVRGGISAPSVSGLVHRGISKNEATLETGVASSIAIGKRHDANISINKSQIKAIEKICNSLGIQVVFEDLREMVYKGKIISADGYVEKETGIIHLNTYAKNPVGFVFKHELTHYSEKAKGYLDFAKQVKQSGVYQKWITEKMGESDVRVAEYKYKQEVLATYASIESINNPKIEAEMIADFVGDMLFTEDGSGMAALVSDIEVKHRNKVIQFVLDFISYIKERLVGQKHITLELSKLENNFKRILSEAAHTNGLYDNEIRFSICKILGESGIDYGEGVYLDSNKLSNLSQEERVAEVKNGVARLGGVVFSAFDNDGNEVKIKIAPKTKYINENGRPARFNRHLTNYLENQVKQEALTLIDEIVLKAKFQTNEDAVHAHGWLDNNGKNNWEIWTTYILDKEKTVWEAKLKIANSTNGEKILYDIYPIKKVEQVGTMTTSTTDVNISQNVNESQYAITKSIGENGLKKEDLQTNDAKSSVVTPKSENVKISINSLSKASNKKRDSFNRVLSEAAHTNSSYDNEISFSFGVTQEDINNYVDAAYGKENTQDYKKYAVPTQRLINDVADEIDIAEYSHALRDNDIRHIKNSHGENTNEKYPVTRDDLKRIPWIVQNYDKVFVVKRDGNRIGIIYVKVNEQGLLYFLEQITTIYGNELLLVNKQMIKTGIDNIPNLKGLVDAINKKQSETEFLADLKKVHEVYAQSVNQPHSIISISKITNNVNNDYTTKTDTFYGIAKLNSQEVGYIKQICEKLGVQVIFEDLREMMYKGEIISPDGYVEKETGIIHLNTYAKNPIGFVFKHELTHYSEKAKGYLDFETWVKRSGAYQKWITEKMGESDVRVAQYKYKQNVAKTNVDIYSASDPKAETEMIADFVGDMLFTEDGSGMAALASDIEVNHRNKVIQFVLDFISYIKERLVGIDFIALELSRLEEKFNQLLSEAKNSGVYDNEVKFSSNDKISSRSATLSDDINFLLNKNVTESMIEDNIVKVVTMDSVADLTGKEFEKGSVDLITQVENFFNSVGNIAKSKYGDVKLTCVGIKASLGHGIGRKKAIAFKAVPNVIKYGEVINYRKNWKNRGYDTAVFAAPITIDAQKYFLAAVINVELNKNSYYLHEVALQKVESNASFKTGTVKDGTPSDALPSIYTLLQKLQVVNENTPIITDNSVYKTLNIKERSYIKDICKKLEAQVVFEDLREMVYKGEIISPDGYVEKDTGIIHLNTYAHNPIGFVFKHELTHYSEKAKGYLDFVTEVKQSGVYQKWITEKMGESDVRVAEYKYKQEVLATYVDIESINNPKIEAEMIADFVGDMLFTDNGSGMVALTVELDAKKINVVVQWLIDFISYLKNKLFGQKYMALELSVLQDGLRRLIIDASHEYANMEFDNKTEVNNTIDDMHKSTLVNDGPDISFCFAHCGDEELVSKAKEMEDNGADGVTIYKQLGVFKNVFGDWVAEIELDRFRFCPYGNSSTKNNLIEERGQITGRLRDMVIWPDLYEKFPEFENVKVVIRTSPYSHDTIKFVPEKNVGKVIINKKLLDNYKTGKNMDAKEYMVNAIQRMIQLSEGHYIGRSYDYWKTLEEKGELPYSQSRGRYLTAKDMMRYFIDNYDAEMASRRQYVKDVVTYEDKGKRDYKNSALYLPYINSDDVIVYDKRNRLIALSETKEEKAKASKIAALKQKQIEKEIEKSQVKETGETTQKIKDFVWVKEKKHSAEFRQKFSNIKGGNSGAFEKSEIASERRFENQCNIISKTPIAALDTIGRGVHPQIRERGNGTITINNQGQLSSLYALSLNGDNVFKQLQTGLKLGTIDSLIESFNDLDIENISSSKIKIFEFFAIAKDPLRLECEPSKLSTKEIGKQLLDQGYLTKGEYSRLMRADSAHKQITTGLKNLLIDMGFDSIVYENQKYDKGSMTLIVLNESQLIPVAKDGILIEDNGVEDLTYENYASDENMRVDGAQENKEKLAMYIKEPEYDLRTARKQVDSRIKMGDAGCFEETHLSSEEAYEYMRDELEKNFNKELSGYDKAGRKFANKALKNLDRCAFRDENGDILTFSLWNTKPKNISQAAKMGIEFGSVNSAFKKFFAHKDGNFKRYNGVFEEFILNCCAPLILPFDSWNTIELADYFLDKKEISQNYYEKLTSLRSINSPTYISDAAQKLQEEIKRMGYDCIVFAKSRGEKTVVTLYDELLIPISQNGILNQDCKLYDDTEYKENNDSKASGVIEQKSRSKRDFGEIKDVIMSESSATKKLKHLTEFLSYSSNSILEENENIKVGFSGVLENITNNFWNFISICNQLTKETVTEINQYDTADRYVEEEIRQTTSNTKFKDKDGKLLSLFFWNKYGDFSFKHSALGYTLTTLEGAHNDYLAEREKQQKIKTGEYVECYVKASSVYVLKNPLTELTPKKLAEELYKSGVISGNEFRAVRSIVNSDKPNHLSGATRCLNSIMVKKGYDCIVYMDSSRETGGIRVIVFDQSQFIPVSVNGQAIENNVEKTDGIMLDGIGDVEYNEIEKVKCINERLEGKEHAVTKVPFVKKHIAINGKILEVVVPEFESLFDAQLPEELYMVSNKRQFKECYRQLREALKNNAKLREKFTVEQLKELENGKQLKKYTWHHDAVAGRMQLVNGYIHKKTGHKGGRFFWGGGSKNR